ncbi:NAD(P)/FAD-dependent oxidoreductase [Fimbriiglobus ruber]|uniref:FAD-binding protein n=1 Tax=Fimbriiglobus ruber TaxID=1908690 RepID=A0A225CYS9_9BACT|nr:NAD(P)/FAD-dependent oxidoreductase [Fimbriiglobus ruber]OWK34540.1 FAD-binding protein [Fimbriiglobus ruber]
MTQAANDADVIVIGGGPSGSTVATLIAQKGYTVDLYERDHFPRFHIGESLIPQTYWVLERLNMLDTMRNSHFIKKYSVQFVNQKGKLSEPFYFVDHKPHESSQTWQVRRSEFDHLLLNNARKHGVRVHEGVRALEVLFDGKRAVGARIQPENGPEREVKAKVVVDASGQSTMLLGRLGIRDWDPVLRKGAVWTYWKGAYRDKGHDEGATIVLQTEGKKGWFWYIPLHDDIISVGVVAGYDHLFQNRSSKDLETIYFEEVARCPGLQPRIANATRCDIFRAQKEYSYRSKQAAGDGWAVVGDAFGFLDPLYSSGVLLALKSGQMAADAITDALAAGDTSESRLRVWEPGFVQGMERMRKLVCVFYDGFSFGRFVHRYPHLKGLVTDVLIGDLFKDEVDVLWPLIDEMQAEHAAAVKAAQTAAVVTTGGSS